MASASLVCAKCKSPLEAPGTTFSACCTACGQWHYINRSGPVPAATPVADTPSSTGEATAGPNTGAVAEACPTKIEEELARLDEDWVWERKKHLVITWTGDTDVPSLTGGVLAGVLITLAGATLLYFTGGSEFVDRLSGLALIVAGIAFGGYRVRKALTYRQAYRRYQSRRRASSQAHGN